MAGLQPPNEALQEYIEEILAIEGVDACSLVSKDGVVRNTSFHDTIIASTIGAMSATMLASAGAAAGMADLEAPSSVFADTHDGGILVVNAGNDLLISAILIHSVDVHSVFTRIAEIARRIGEEV